jgi:WhiB family redox-sensing transcriptional regulator
MQYPPPDQSSAATAPLFDGTQACAGADLNLFFPRFRGVPAQAAVREAKELCAGCAFRQPCLDYALYAQGAPGRYVAGVWGGTSEGERTAMRRLQRQAERVAS